MIEAVKSVKPAVVWIADSSKTSDFFREILGPNIELRHFDSLAELRQALDLGRSRPYSFPTLLIVDAVLKDGNLVEAWTRQPVPLPPFIVFSDCKDVPVIEGCLDLGARDFLPRSVDPGLLKVKLHRLIDAAAEIDAKQSIGLQLDTFSLIVANKEGVDVRLTVKEFQVLLLIHESYPKGIPREQLRKQVWEDLTVGPKTLDAHIFKLRRKLEHLGFEILFSSDFKYMLRSR